MRILVITFSISNGGDFLIEKRMNALVKKTWSEAEVDTICGVQAVLDIQTLNRYDIIIAGGGPYYDDRVVRELLIPLFSQIDDIVPPIHILGSGIYGDDFFAEAIIQKRFADDVLKLFKNIEKKGGSLGCRDILSWQVMRNNGFKNVYLTGCPAWFDFEFMECFDKPINRENEIKEIIISDPGVTKKAEEQEIRANQAIKVVETVRQLFPEAVIKFTFNNGINTKYSHICNNIVREYLDQSKVLYYDLSYDSDRFSVYDNADLHIGFRVHSHIYCLSRRIPSILIEEDLRGYGMNETLALPHLLSFNELAAHIKNKYEPNPYLCIQMKDVYDYMVATHFSKYQNTFHIMWDIYYNSYMDWVSFVNHSWRKGEESVGRGN